MLEISYAAAVRRAVELGGFHEFVRLFWGFTLEAAHYIDNWHNINVCQALELVGRRKVPGGPTGPRLVINQPPGTGKSRIVSVLWPAWVWTFAPGHRWICTSYSQQLAERDAEKFLAVLQCPLYRMCWPHVQLSKRGGRAAVGRIENTAGGARFSFGLLGQILGQHANTIIIDDPISPEKATAISGVDLDRIERTYRGTLLFRHAEPVSEFAVVLIMQRLASGDLSDVLLSTGAQHLMYPMRYRPNAPWDRGNTMGIVDPRTEPGELLWPRRFPLPLVEEKEKEFQFPAIVAAQYQQNPVPDTGAFFERAWFVEYDALPPDWELAYVQSWDLGFKGKGERGATDAHSRTHGALWAIHGHGQAERYYLVDEIIGTWNYPQAKEQFRQAQSRARWDRTSAILIEDKAGGIGLIDEMRHEFPLITPIEPKGSKEDRARRHSVRVSNGMVLVPRAPWVGEFIGELVQFPKQRHNDRVDTTTQLLDYMTSPGALAATRLGELARVMQGG